MFCPNCGAKIEDTDAQFCPDCGTRMPSAARTPLPAAKSAKAAPFDYAKYAVRMKAGDTEAFQILYEKTYRDMYYLALKLMKNETEAEDVLQDAYIRAWNSIGSLNDPNAFRGWLSRIVTNTAKNALAKNTPVLFSQMESEDEDGEDYIFDIPDETNVSQPELHYTEKETQELVRELIDSLSDEQRFCILMFHLEGQSIHDIAETLGVSENTVKSRLNYGRKNIAKKAEELRKKGYTLYSFAPLPLLLLLLRSEMGSETAAKIAASAMRRSSGPVLSKAAPAASSAPNAASGIRNISPHGTAADAAKEGVRNTIRSASSAGTAPAAPAAAAAHTAAKAAFFTTTGGKITAAVAAFAITAGVAGGGAAVIYHAVQPEPAAVVEEEPVEAPAEEPVETVIEAPEEEAAPAEEEVPAEEEIPEESEPETVEISPDELPNYISGNLTEYELETVLAYGLCRGMPDLSGNYAQGVMNEIIQAQDPDTGTARFETGMMGYQTTFSLAEINRYFSSFTDYQFSGDNIALIERGTTIAYSPAQINYVASADITSITLVDGQLIICYDFYCKKDSYGDGSAEITQAKRQAVFEQLPDGMYRAVSVADLET